MKLPFNFANKSLWERRFLTSPHQLKTMFMQSEKKVMFPPSDQLGRPTQIISFYSS